MTSPFTPTSGPENEASSTSQTLVQESQSRPTKHLSGDFRKDNIQNDYIIERSPASSSQTPQSNTYPYPVIVSPDIPVYQAPRTPHAVRGTHDTHSGGSFHKLPSPPTVSVGTAKVRAEEIGLVLLVLMLWMGAITLFINRWGKLRMLEPYQPAYTAPVPPPRPAPQVGPCINIQSTSDLALAESGSASGRCEWGVPGSYGRGSLAGGYLGMSRSPSCLSVRQLDPTRKVKSAVDLVSLVMQEKMASNMHIATNV
ncbi:uncharacterized protein LOC134764834 [Penaeus indicus]|uniref:uncharacterized protein LOC134764834 n=1 Tax=Penaeus indicus TaxID=29960 RepID=UPI00300C83B2